MAFGQWAEEDGQAMDAAAKTAEQDLKGLQTAQQIYDWMKKWKNAAGYKRLGKILASLGATPNEQKAIESAAALKRTVIAAATGQPGSIAVAAIKATKRKGQK